MRSLSSDKKSFDLSRGDLGKVLLVEIIGAAYVHKVTGRLDIVRGNLIKRIYFFKSLPTYVTSTAPSESLLEVAGQTRWLRPDDILQLRSMQAEMDLSTEELFKALELLDNSEIYALQVETFMQMILEACSCQEGKYEMHFGDDMIAEAPFFDLNPLDIIYQGIKAYKPLDLGEELQQIQHKKARLNHGREKIVTLPEIYYERSDVLDIFENEMTISDSIPRLYQEFGDLTESMLFLYLLLVTGLLQIIENPAPEQRGTSTYIFGREGQPESAPSNKLSDGTVYIHTLKKRQTSLETPPERPVVEEPKKPEPEPTAPPSALEAPPPVFEAPSFVPEAALTVPETPSFAPEALAPEPFEQAEPPPVPDDDWGDTVPGVPPATKEVLPEHEVLPEAESLPEIEIVKGGSVQLKTPAVNKKDLA